MASRNVMMESSKCLSGRAFDRVASTRPSGLRGESARSLGHEKRVAGQHATEVMLKSDIRAALEVIQTQLALEVLVDAFGAPSLLETADELLS